FPLGEYRKKDERKIAKQFGFITADKPDSQGICFVGKEPFEKFLSRYIKENPGNIIDKNKKIIGKHKGARFYTIGQRKGLGISSVKPLFVIKKDIKKNEIMIGYEDNKALFNERLTIKDIHEIYPKSLSSINKNIKYIYAKIRHQQKDQKIKDVKLLKTGKMKIIFKEPQRSVTSGQSVVIYRGDEVLGGGIIT
ncbi:MAG: tRNA-specific 2-thiouridylase, partial [Patescibacteria group bacterium]